MTGAREGRVQHEDSDIDRAANQGCITQRDAWMRRKQCIGQTHENPVVSVESGRQNHGLPETTADAFGQIRNAADDYPGNNPFSLFYFERRIDKHYKILLF
jgi:hypothetical protein